MVRAAVALGQVADLRRAGDPIQALAGSYDLGIMSQRVNFCPYPVYLRGEAYLSAQQGAAAAAQFQKILDHPGLVVNQIIGSLAHLGLGRAYALQAGRSLHGEGGGQKPALQPDALAKARVAYQDFFAIWKDADPDLPILKQAKAEYAKMSR